MALTVYPVQGYDSFISLEDADAYLVGIGHTDWSAHSQARREAALRRGTQFVFSRRLTSEALWDESVTPNVARVHPNVKAATAEAAVRDTRGTLYRDVDPSPVLEKTVGPLTLKYGQPTNGGAVRIPVIEDLLFGLVYTGAGFGPVTFERV